MLQVTHFLRTVPLLYQRQCSRLYQQHRQSKPEDVPHKVADFRSDVLSRPTPSMLRHMLESASYGDDVFGENQTVNDLEQRVASSLGHEAGLFIPSGTMGNLLCVMAQCQRRGSEAIVGDISHIHLYEQGGIAALGGVHHRTASTKQDGTLCLDQCQRLVRGNPHDPHSPRTELLCLENSHGELGGKALPLEFFRQARDLCDSNGIRLHCDGARLMNAAFAAGVQPIEFGRLLHSVTICFSKGLGAPVGSCIASDAATVHACRRLRKALGGSSRQPGILAAAADRSLDIAADTIADDHRRAMAVYTDLTQKVRLPSWLSVNKPDTNILMMRLTDDAPVPAARLVEMLDTPTPESPISIRSIAFSSKMLRLVTYNCISDSDCDLLVQKVDWMVKQML